MTKEQAIEKCAKAILRSMRYRESNWEKSDAKGFATKLVTWLEADEIARMFVKNIQCICFELVVDAVAETDGDQ
jgi:hypothetical protein